jgi:hypothetical protein
MHSIRSLHKMTSMRSILRRKFSKDLPKKASVVPSAPSKAKGKSINSEPDTVVKQRRNGPNPQLQITKDDLRKHLLSDKKPDEGGYDSDAEMLDDIAKNIVKKSPSKRPSIHSVDWTTSTGRSDEPDNRLLVPTHLSQQDHSGFVYQGPHQCRAQMPSPSLQYPQTIGSVPIESLQSSLQHTKPTVGYVW